MATKSPVASSIAAEFETERDTKNTRRFVEIHVADGDEPVLDTIYVPKSTLALIGDPANIKVTIEAI